MAAYYTLMTAGQAVRLRLSRAVGQGRSAAPVRVVHLGLGNFVRAHPCWYTEHASDAGSWGIAGFTGRASQQLVDQLTAQQGLYTLVSRGPDVDRFEVISSLSLAHVAADHDAWLRYFKAPELAAVTITVTEAGYLRGTDGGLDAGRPEVRADVQMLRDDPTRLVRSAPGRLVAGLAARRSADAGPLALVPCDNTPGNGALAERVVRDLAERVDTDLAAWISDSVAVVTTMADRITPGVTPGDASTVLEHTGFVDRCPVVTEPFREWVLSGEFPVGRPRWEDAGAIFTDDIVPHEQRKLWLLNGAHSLLAYAGTIRGHQTIAAAVRDEICRAWVMEWWAEALPHLDQPAADLAAYRDALLQRFSNARVHDRLDRIAADGSQKLPIRILPVLRAERAAGRVPVGATRVLAAWVCYLRNAGASASDARADEVVPLAAGPLGTAVPRVLSWLDPALAGDAAVVATVIEQSHELAATSQRG
jgi:fructuronate reductase